MEQKVFSCILREPQMSASNTGAQGGGVVKLPPGFYGNAEADYSDASFTVNSCSVTIKPLTVPCFVLFCFFFFCGIFEDDSKVREGWDTGKAV